MRKKLLSRLMLLLAFVLTGASNAWADVETLDFAAQGYENSQQITETSGMVVKATFTNGGTATAYYNTGTAVRVYNGGTMTISAGENLITQIVFTYELNGTATVSVEGKTNSGSYDDATKTWTGSDTEVVLTAGTAKHVRISKVEVTYTSGGDTPSDTREATTVTIDASGISNDMANGNTAGQLTASVTTQDGAPITGATVTWASSNEGVASIDEDGNVTLEDLGETTITATYAGDEVNYKGSSATYKLMVIDSDQPGQTAENPYTVAQARDAIDAGEGVTGVYAKGIVSEIVTAFNSQYGNISYNISEDGTTESDQLQAYRGFSYNGEKFTSADDIKVGDVVVIYGNLKKYNTTYEFDANNQLVSLQRDETKQEAGLAYETTSFIINVGESFTAPELTNPNNLTVTYTSSNESVATVDANTGVVTLANGIGVTTIKAKFEGNDNYFAGEASYTLEVINPNVPGKTVENAYTVAQARDAIDAGEGVTGVYAKGIVSEIVTAFNSQFGNISYNISEDGTTESDQLQAYRGFSYNGEKFTSADDIKVGDVVVIYGNLKKYTKDDVDTYEFDAGNQLVSLQRDETPEIEVAAPTFSVAGGEVESGTTVALIQEEADDIYYTTDGSEPDAVTGGSTRYTSPIVIDKDMTIKAIAVLGDAVSAVATATYTIKTVEPEPVLEPIVAAGEVIVFADLELENGVQYKNPFVNSSNTFSVIFAGGANDGKYYDTGTGIRVYGNGTMKISANGDKMLTKIVVKYDGTDKPESGDVDAGSYDAETGIWTGEAESVTFTRPSGKGHWRVQSVSATCGYEVTITSAGWATYVPYVDVSFNASGVTAYTAKVNGAYVDLTEVNAVPAGTPVVLKGDEGTYEITKTSDVAAVEGNELVASDGTVTGDGTIYALGLDKSIVTHAVYGFYKVATNATVPAGKAYLKVGASVRDFLAFTEGEADGVNVIENGRLTIDNAVFDLTGRRVVKSAKGLYIVNGKKIVK